MTAAAGSGSDVDLRILMTLPKSPLAGNASDISGCF